MKRSNRMQGAWIALAALALASCTPRAGDATSGRAPATAQAAAASGPARAARGNGESRWPAGTWNSRETRIVEPDSVWRRILTREQYQVTREKGTERAFSGTYWNHHADGIYRCSDCGYPLFDSKTKFESGTGWPSFWAPVGPKHVKLVEDRSLGMVRTEVECPRCGAHLGHVFDDGPKPTGLRYCINSVSLAFTPRGEAARP